jgi:hypothetical protein
MSAFKDMLIDIQESIERGTLSYQQIANMYGLPVKDVMLIAEELMDQYDDARYDDYMDGDFDSAMASAGMGTDEDYGYYGMEDE